MIRIFKRQEPEFFLNWKNRLKVRTQKPSYADLSDFKNKEIKEELHEALLEEQGGLCCYCGRKVMLENSHIEHFRPQSRYPDCSVIYENLHTSCIRSPHKGSIRYCGHFKDDKFDENLCISPLETDCEKRFLYTFEGEIQPRDEHDKNASYMIEILNLNAPPLVGRRKDLLRQTLPPEFFDNTSPEMLQNLRTAYQERDSCGHYMEFRQVLSRYIDQNCNCRQVDV